MAGRAGRAAVAAFAIALPLCAGKKAPPPPSAIEEYINAATAFAEGQGRAGIAPGSLYSTQGRLADLSRDLRASQVGDMVTIVVSDKASAIARGVTNSTRKSSAKSSIAALAGPTNPARGLANLAGLNSDQNLQGQGETSRETVLTTTLSARVTHVLPNGYLVVEGTKDVAINSERQSIKVKGVVRWNDLTPSNQVRSDRLAALDIQINGRGVVGDAIRRPALFYRILLGLLPF